jgi:hypothetical protein
MKTTEMRDSDAVKLSKTVEEYAKNGNPLLRLMVAQSNDAVHTLTQERFIGLLNDPWAAVRAAMLERSATVKKIQDFDIPLPSILNNISIGTDPKYLRPSSKDKAELAWKVAELAVSDNFSRLFVAQSSEAVLYLSKENFASFLKDPWEPVQEAIRKHAETKEIAKQFGIEIFPTPVEIRRLRRDSLS